ncbi:MULTISPECIES: FtsX-like permease family protein [unclassified Micromonospora]|uniref:FtsX-like permease family protein n=1 Tax=unclassified Micromonospora TaxID=2617518 RepID=UPI002FF02368
MTRRPNRLSDALVSWRTALRISWRETRRAKGRSALVVAMIATPVLALSFAAASYDMLQLTDDERLQRTLGAADARVTWDYVGAVEQSPDGDLLTATGIHRRSAAADHEPATTAEVATALPSGSRVVPVWDEQRWDWRTADGVGGVPSYGLDLADPVTEGMARLREGRAPTGATEVTASEAALRRLGVALGGTVELAEGSRRFTVVGIVELPDDLGEVVVLPPAARTDPPNAWLVDAPAPVAWDQVRRLNAEGLLVISRAVLRDPPPVQQTPPSKVDARSVGIGVLLGGLGAMQIVLLAGPAFAIGARRRQRDLALVAANGGSPAHLRRIVLADGVVLGLAGAVTGILLGAILAVAGRPLVEEHLAQARAGGYRFFPLALLAVAGLAVLTGVVAALVPAFVAARQNVVVALTGRRGVTRSRRRWVAVGLVLAAGGTGLAAYAAVRASTNLLLAGLMLTQLGLVLCTPALVGLLARLGRHLPLTPRIALRDAGRNRAATAPAISAVMAAVAGTICLGVYQNSSDARSDAAYRPSTPTGHVTVVNPLRPDQRPIPVDRLAAIADRTLPAAGVAEIRVPGCRGWDPGDCPNTSVDLVLPPQQQCPFFELQRPLTPQEQRQARADARCHSPQETYSRDYAWLVVDDGSAVAPLTGAHGDDLARAVDTLRAGGVVVTDSRYVVDGTVTVQPPAVPTRGGPLKGAKEPATLTLPGYALATGIRSDRTIISPAALARAGLVAHQWGFVIATRAPDTAAEDRFRAEVSALSAGLRVSVERGPATSGDPVLLVLAVAAGLITLGAVGIATGLTAADSRPDLSILAAVGASPLVRRKLSLSQSGVIAGLGSLLGMTVGLVAGVAILTAVNQTYLGTWPGGDPYPIVVPWSVLGALAVVPLVAMLGAGLLTRSRLPIERRLD